MQYIQGSKFKEITDLVFAPTPKAKDLWAIGDYDNLQNNFFLEACKKGTTTSVYTHGIYARQALKVLADFKRDFVLVTHNSDEAINDTYDIPDNVIKWYAQNVNTYNPKVSSLPIGLENDMWGMHHWKPPLHKLSVIEQKMGEEKDYRNMLYMNFNPATAPHNRNHVWEMFKDKPWVTAHRGSNFSEFDNYITNVRHHKFVLCPEGNGMDTHRTWETLYLGNIPIEKRNKNNRFYTDLPILFVDEWEEVTEELLRKAYWTIKLQDWNMEKLDMQYWINKIKSW